MQLISLSRTRRIQRKSLKYKSILTDFHAQTNNHEYNTKNVNPDIHDTFTNHMLDISEIKQNAPYPLMRDIEAEKKCTERVQVIYKTHLENVFIWKMYPFHRFPDFILIKIINSYTYPNIVITEQSLNQMEGHAFKEFIDDFNSKH